jgi:uncharacterized protein with von Willebrand factor type A (vWA) domain
MTDFIENTLQFSRALRKKKVGITIENVLAALRGISFIDIQKKQDFYDLLKSNFVSRREEIKPFDELFDQFWSFQAKVDLSIKRRIERETKVLEEKSVGVSFEMEKGDKLLLKDWAEEREENGRTESRDLPGYSPDEVLGSKDFGHLGMDEMEKVKEIVSTLSRKLALALSRRWKRGKRGDQIDLRSSIRQSLKYGGEMMELRRKQPRPKPLRLILLCDVSGSMDIYSHFFLLFMYGLQNHYHFCETFAFSTRLSHLTFLLKGRPFEEVLTMLSKRVLDWAGGTNIGNALHQLHRHHFGLYHPNRTVFVIFSDGWDRGDTALLNSEMKNLKRQVKTVIWLNPLLGSPAYQPLCKGMAAALPHLDHFFPCHNLSSLRNLSHLIARM